MFSGTFYEPHIYLEQIDEMFSDNELIKMFYHNLADYMTDRNEVSTEQAVVDVMDLMRLIMSEKQVIQLFRFAEPVDWLARMYYRKQIVQVIADSGIDIWLLGRGWENHPAAMLDNVHIINDRIPFKDTLPVMAKAKINLNIMPWFKMEHMTEYLIFYCKAHFLLQIKANGSKIISLMMKILYFMI